MSPIRRLFRKFSSFSASARGERMQRGQAMAEYWPTIPAGILIMLSATAIVGIITGALNKTVEGLTGAGLTCEEETSEVVEGPRHATAECHEFELVAESYDPVTDRTTLTYKVTSCDDPSISNWILGIPRSVFDEIVAIDAGGATWEWTDGREPNGPGVAGLKFEGYHWSYAAADSGIVLVDWSYQEMDSATVLITLGGYFDFSVVNIGVKAGRETYTTTITAPTAPSTPPATDGDDAC